MKRLLLVLAFLVSPIFAATITGPIGDLTGGAYSPRVEFWPQSTPFFSGTTAIVGPMKTVAVTNGTFSTTLVAGRYYTRFPPTTNGFTIYVPTGTNTYTLSQVATNVFYVVDSSTFTNLVEAITNNDTRSVVLDNLATKTNSAQFRFGATMGFTSDDNYNIGSPSGSTFGRPKGVYAIDFYGNGTYLTNLQADKITGTLTNNTTGNAAGATNYLESGQYLGVWDDVRATSMGQAGVLGFGDGTRAYTTRGTLYAQQRIGAPISDASCELGTPAPFFYGGKWYFGHLTLGYLNTSSPTNTWGLMRSDDEGMTWTRHAFINVATVAPDVAPQSVRQVWAPKPFIDTDGRLHMLLCIGTNATQASVNMKIYATYPTDSTLLNWSTPQLCSGIPMSSFDASIVRSNNSANYLMVFRLNSAYNEVYTSTSITNGWTALKTGDWAGWGAYVEAVNLHQLKSDGSWVALMVSNSAASSLGTCISTSTNFTDWTVLKQMPGSKNGHGSVFQSARAISSAPFTRFTVGYSNSTYGASYSLGTFTNSPDNALLSLNSGGDYTLLGFSSKQANQLLTDQMAYGNAFYFSRKAAAGADIFYNNGVNNNLRFYGGQDFPTNQASTTTIDLNAPYGALSTAVNVTLTGLLNVAAGATDVQWATRFYTNTSGSTKTITLPAGWIGSTGTEYLTNQGVVSIVLYPGLGTNVTYRSLK